MPKVLATAISVGGSRDYVKAVNLVARLKGINTADLVREALDSRYGSEIRDAEILLANGEPQKNQMVRTESA